MSWCWHLPHQHRTGADYGSEGNNAVTLACHVIPASGRLVDVDIPELSESPWPGFDIF